MPNKAYLEITNVCNLNCSFCHGTKREKRFMSVPEFTVAAERLRPFADYLYFHLMGEPLLHPRLKELFEIAGELGYKVIITTNGTLLAEKADILLNAKALHKVSISLHSFEANDQGSDMGEYIDSCLQFCKEATLNGKICALRLWNLGGKSSLNEMIVTRMKQIFPPTEDNPWQEGRSGCKIKEKLYLEWGNHFDWPDIDLPVVGSNHGCYGLRDQVGVLCDGTVVPCCLDADGAVRLGNIFDSGIEEILQTERAKSLKVQLQNGRVTEPLCIRCGFASERFGR